MNTTNLGRLALLTLLAPICTLVACGSEASLGSDGTPAGSAGKSSDAGATASGGSGSLAGTGASSDAGATASGGSGSLAGTGASSDGGAIASGGSGALAGNGGASTDPCLTVKCASGYHCEGIPTTDVTQTFGCVKNDASKACVVDGDCTLYRDYCVACNCVVASNKSPGIAAPGSECSASMMVSCLVDACLGKSAKCNGGQCAIQ